MSSPVGHKGGRPPKDPEERKSEHIKIALKPARKRMLRRESRRCRSSVSTLLRKCAFEEIEPQGRAIPKPVVFRELMRNARGFYYSIQGSSAELTRQLNELKTNLTMLLAELDQDKKKLEALRQKLPHEVRTGGAGDSQMIRVSRKKKRWLTRKAEEASLPVSTLVRQRALSRLEDREMIEETAGWIRLWLDRIDLIRSLDFEKREKNVRDRMDTLAYEIEQTAVDVL